MIVVTSDMWYTHIQWTYWTLFCENKSFNSYSYPKCSWTCDTHEPWSVSACMHLSCMHLSCRFLYIKYFVSTLVHLGVYRPACIFHVDSKYSVPTLVHLEVAMGGCHWDILWKLKLFFARIFCMSLHILLEKLHSMIHVATCIILNATCTSTGAQKIS